MPTQEYFSQTRDEIVALVPTSCKKILDVGCGFGGLGKALMKQRSVELHGIEIEPSAEVHLKGIYSNYFISDVENIGHKLEPHRYDCIIFADILEHLVNPWAALKQYVNHLEPDGYVIISIPNVRNASVIYNLLFKGSWKYKSSGIMDKGHLRFFTRSDATKMIEASGLRIVHKEEKMDKHSFFRRLMLYLPTLLIPDLSVCQFLFKTKLVNR